MEFLCFIRFDEVARATGGLNRSHGYFRNVTKRDSLANDSIDAATGRVKTSPAISEAHPLPVFSKQFRPTVTRRTHRT
ncbi:hypothetical protein OKW43_006443 [Paraburkholderia sp. WC7.3g]